MQVTVCYEWLISPTKAPESRVINADCGFHREGKHAGEGVKAKVGRKVAVQRWFVQITRAILEINCPTFYLSLFPENTTDLHLLALPVSRSAGTKQRIARGLEGPRGCAQPGGAEGGRGTV